MADFKNNNIANYYKNKYKQQCKKHNYIRKKIILKKDPKIGKRATNYYDNHNSLQSFTTLIS
jgi:hypothetical protein